MGKTRQIARVLELLKEYTNRIQDKKAGRRKGEQQTKEGQGGVEKKVRGGA